jgi:hypothetical protein
MYRARTIKKYCIENNCMIRMLGGGNTIWQGEGESPQSTLQGAVDQLWSHSCLGRRSQLFQGKEYISCQPDT